MSTNASIDETQTPSGDRASADEIAADTASLPSSKAQRRKRSKRSIALIVVSAIAVFGWVAFGVAASVASNTALELNAAQSANTELSGENDSLTSDLETVTESRDSYQDAASDVAKKEIELSTKEAALKTREDALVSAEKHIEESTLKDGYSYITGATMQPGTYETSSTSSRCYWSILKSGTNGSDIVDNDLGAQGVIRVTVNGGQDFTSHDCGAWRKIG